MINGEPKIIRFSLKAQARIVESLGLDSVEKIPELMRKMNAEILAHLVSCALVEEHAMSVSEVMEAGLPMYPTMEALFKAINLAMWGTVDGHPFDRSENDAQKMASANDGTSMPH